jgi:plastocyanin
MGLNLKKSGLLILVLIAVLTGCASNGRVETAAPMSAGGSIITIDASNYKFQPSEIRVDKPGLLAVQIHNVSGSVRNFTLEDPRGKVLRSVDVDPAGSMIMNVELPRPGVYGFYARKTLHAPLGMKGKIIVGRR